MKRAQKGDSAAASETVTKGQRSRRLRMSVSVRLVGARAVARRSLRRGRKVEEKLARARGPMEV